MESIWLVIEKEDKEAWPTLMHSIMNIIKSKYKTYTYLSYPKSLRYIKVRFIDCNQIREILDKLKIKLDDEEPCTCGCYSTDFERLVNHIELMIYPGELCYTIGRSISTEEGLVNERFNVVRYILLYLWKELEKIGIKSHVDYGDCRDIEWIDGAVSEMLEELE